MRLSDYVVLSLIIMICLLNIPPLVVDRWARSRNAEVMNSFRERQTPGQENKKKADRTEMVTLQYRVARDAFAPSNKFVAVSGKGMSAPLEVTWDLPQAEDNEKKAAQDRQKKVFDDLIKKLEEKGINGVEFECRGEWLDKGFRLRLRTVPQLTKEGKQRIQEHRP
jgi:hypothetical protein